MFLPRVDYYYQSDGEHVNSKSLRAGLVNDISPWMRY